MVLEIGVPVANTTLGALTLTPDGADFSSGGTWAWQTSPSGAYDSITYSCGSGGTSISVGAGGSCDVTGVALLTPNLVIRVNANGHQYVRTYDWNDYDN